MLELAVDLDGGSNPSSLADRLLSLAVALDGTGDLDSSREVLARAASLGIVDGDAELTARAAVKYALPSDWFSGDHRAIELLKRAEHMNPSPPMLAAVIASRGLVEMRIPVVHEDDNQYAWITRPETARSFTEQALEMASPEHDYERAVALLAWRGTHRAPRFLIRRRSVTTELLEIAHRINDPWILVMAAEWSAVDHIESGDRVAYDKAVATSRWAAEHDGNPRLRWRSLATAAGGAYLDWQPAIAQQHIAEAAAALAKTSSPCWIGAEILFAGEELISRDDPREMAQHLDHNSVATQLNPLAQAGFAYICAWAGDPTAGQTFLEKSWRALDEESSMLLHAARLSAASIQLGDLARMQALIDLLTPYSEHVVVDAHGWWIDGPVASWLAHLRFAIDERAASSKHLRSAFELARAVNDVRSLRRLDNLAKRLGVAEEFEETLRVVDPGLLAAREMDVLRLMADGKTNAEIAQTLAFSVSTIRNSTVEIYRRLGVKGRADAVARAHQLGLLGN
jgi:DNA-binding CsgD family transcriptional regulator